MERWTCLGEIFSGCATALRICRQVEGLTTWVFFGYSVLLPPKIVGFELLKGIVMWRRSSFPILYGQWYSPAMATRQCLVHRKVAISCSYWRVNVCDRFGDRAQK